MPSDMNPQLNPRKTQKTLKYVFTVHLKNFTVIKTYTAQNDKLITRLLIGEVGKGSGTGVIRGTTLVAAWRT